VVTLRSLLSSKGALANHLSSYEERSDQIAMSETIWTAFEEEKIALIEAGTGIGKSIAYLAPALLWAHETGEKVVISTYTIALQEQLVEKDIPLLLELLGLNLKVRLVKGMGNYLCLRKMEDPLVQQQLGPKALPLVNWARETQDGTQSDLPFPLAAHEWQKIHAEGSRCSYGRCPHFRSCFFFDARSELAEADILIVNHHLLLADLQSAEKQRILPEYKRLILDEAHHFEDVALHALSDRLSANDLWRQMAQIHSESAAEGSRLSVLKNTAEGSLKTRLSIDLPAQHDELARAIHSAFTALPPEMRVRQSTLESANWKELSLEFENLINKLRRYSASLLALKEDCERASENVLFEIESAAQRLQEASVFLNDFFQAKFEPRNVRWTQNSRGSVSIAKANLSVAQYLQEHLFDSLKTAVLCSATLAIQGKFTYAANRLGISQEGLITKVFHSPFDYKTRTLLLASRDFLEPTDPGFLKEVCESILKAMKASGGGAFLLFTSYEQLNQCYERIAETLRDWGLMPLKQGELGRFALLQAFKEQDRAVLFGTDSFWEGVDVPGNALRCVVIVKLPFKVPTDPLVEARAELLKQEGGDPFMEESLPQAVMKFKQGFGRLMRQKDDRGCILCLDRRILTKAYGRIFLGSLPETLIQFGSKNDVFQEMEKFYL